MTEEITIPGLVRMPLNVGTAERVRTEFFYLINLEELTVDLVNGVPSLAPWPERERKDFWTDFEIATLIHNLSPATVATIDEDEKQRLIRNTNSLLDDSDLNDQAWKYGRSSLPAQRGWNSEMVDPEGARYIGPTVLFVSEKNYRSRKLKRRYLDLIRQRTYRAFHEDAHYLSRLAQFDRDYLAPLKRRQAEVDEALATARHIISRVSNAHMGVVAMFHCAESSEARKRRWGRRPPLEPDDSMYAKQIVPRLPTAEEVENAEFVRDSYLPQLFKDLNELLAWLSSGAKKDGKTFAKARIRNGLADDLLEQLRQNEDILAVLENHLYVDKLLWRRVENLLLESFHHLLLAPNTREALLQGELAELAIYVSERAPAMEFLTERTKRAQEIKAAMERFVPAAELGGSPTRLSAAFLSLKSHADPLLDHRSTITKLWSLATPTLMEHIERAAEKAGDPNPSAVAASWGWRSSFAIIELDGETQRDVWERAVRFTESPTTSEAKNIFAADGLQVENRFWNTQASWSAYETAVAVIAATDAVMAHADKPSTDTAISAWTSALEAVKAIPDFASSLKDTQMFVRMSAGPAKSLISKVGSYADAVPLKVATGVIALLKYEATARASRAVMKSRTASAEDKDIAREQGQLGFVSLLVTGAGMAVGSPMLLAGAVLYVGSTVLLNRDLWNACLSGIEGLPGPGRAVKLVWTEYIDGFNAAPSLESILKGTPWETRLKTSLQPLIDVTNDTHEVGRGSFWAISSGNFVMSPRTAAMLRRQYGFHEDFAKELAAY